MKPTWKPMEYEGCVECGAFCDIYTDSSDGAYYDGDSVRCTECGLTGTWVVDEGYGEDGLDTEAFVLWGDKPVAAEAAERE